VLVGRHLLGVCVRGCEARGNVLGGGGRLFGGRAQNDDDGGHNGHHRVSF
jgi:hypothetical protein